MKHKDILETPVRKKKKPTQPHHEEATRQRKQHYIYLGKMHVNKIKENSISKRRENTI